MYKKANGKRGEKITVELIVKIAQELNQNIRELREKNKNPAKSERQILNWITNDSDRHIRNIFLNDAGKFVDRVDSKRKLTPKP